ncbi:hypothetical protein [Sphingomonas sp.]|uniref:hypothetical protein n=1 Tax=Sphingomonas sp. TaxID=28214 RepID=UPI003B000C20
MSDERPDDTTGSLLQRLESLERRVELEAERTLVLQRSLADVTDRLDAARGDVKAARQALEEQAPRIRDALDRTGWHGDELMRLRAALDRLDRQLALDAEENRRGLAGLLERLTSQAR